MLSPRDFSNSVRIRSNSFKAIFLSMFRRISMIGITSFPCAGRYFMEKRGEIFPPYYIATSGDCKVRNRHWIRSGPVAHFSRIFSFRILETSSPAGHSKAQFPYPFVFRSKEVTTVSVQRLSRSHVRSWISNPDSERDPPQTVPSDRP